MHVQPHQLQLQPVLMQVHGSPLHVQFIRLQAHALRSQVPFERLRTHVLRSQAQADRLRPQQPLIDLPYKAIRPATTGAQAYRQAANQFPLTCRHIRSRGAVRMVPPHYFRDTIHP